MARRSQRGGRRGIVTVNSTTGPSRRIDTPPCSCLAKASTIRWLWVLIGLWLVAATALARPCRGGGRDLNRVSRALARAPCRSVDKMFFSPDKRIECCVFCGF